MSNRNFQSKIVSQVDSRPKKFSPSLFPTFVKFWRPHGRRTLLLLPLETGFLLLLTSWFCLPDYSHLPISTSAQRRRTGWEKWISFSNSLLSLKSLHMHQRPGPSTHAKKYFPRRVCKKSISQPPFESRNSKSREYCR